MLLPGKSWNLQEAAFAKMTKLLSRISCVPTEAAGADAKRDAIPLFCHETNRLNFAKRRFLATGRVSQPSPVKIRPVICLGGGVGKRIHLDKLWWHCTINPSQTVSVHYVFFWLGSKQQQQGPYCINENVIFILRFKEFRIWHRPHFPQRALLGSAANQDENRVSCIEQRRT